MNRTLSAIDNSPCYVPSLRKHTGSIESAILMQRLEHYFEQCPEGFYKFLSETPDDPRHRECGSWSEDLGFTEKEFLSAFDEIGVRHASRQDYFAASNSFLDSAGKEKFYCSYHDSEVGLTWYFRNHLVVDNFLDNTYLGL